MTAYSGFCKHAYSAPAIFGNQNTRKRVGLRWHPWESIVTKSVSANDFFCQHPYVLDLVSHSKVHELYPNPKAQRHILYWVCETCPGRSWSRHQLCCSRLQPAAWLRSLWTQKSLSKLLDAAFHRDLCEKWWLSSVVHVNQPSRIVARKD